MAATLSLVLGTAAGFSMSRFSRFPGRLLFGFALLAPLVVPEVILGLSLLLLFVACEGWIGWPSRGILTITVAHATFGACFVSVLVRAQLAGFDHTIEPRVLTQNILTSITHPDAFICLCSRFWPTSAPPTRETSPWWCLVCSPRNRFTECCETC